MKAYKGQSPVSVRFWPRKIKSRPDLCRLMAVIYFRETQKRFYINLPGFFDPKKVAKLDTRGHIIDRNDYDVPTYSRIYRCDLCIGYALHDLLDNAPASEVTKEKLDEAINKHLKEGGEL